MNQLFNGPAMDSISALFVSKDGASRLGERPTRGTSALTDLGLPSAVDRVVGLARDRRRRVVAENTGLPALIVDVLRLDRDVGLQTRREGCAIGEFDMHLGAVCTIFVDSDEAHDFIAEFFTMNHR
jgi:hypothetical protein